MKRFTKSLCDLPNFKKELEEKLNGKLPKPPSSRYSGETRKLGETKAVSQEHAESDLEKSLATRDCKCVLQPNVEFDDSSLESADSYTAPTSMDIQRLKEILYEHTKSTNFTPIIRHGNLKIDEVILTASKLKAEYSQRARTPSCSCALIQRNPFRNHRNVYEWITPSEKPKTCSAKLKKRAIVVRLPGMSDNLNDYNCNKTHGRRAKTNLSYRHKR